MLRHLAVRIILSNVQENSGRIFVVEMDKMEKLPGLNDIRGYKFWKRDDTDRIRTLAMPLPSQMNWSIIILLKI